MNRSDLLDLIILTKQRFGDAQRIAIALHSACLEPDSPTSNSEVMSALHILTLIENSKYSIDEAVRDLDRLRSMIDEKKV